MSRDISFITNVTAAALIDQTGTWTLQGGFPQIVDEVVIRQITYTTAAAAGHDIYVIRSNIGNQIIGAVSNILWFNSNPGTRITLRNPLPNVLTFQIMHPSVPPSPVEDATGDVISISMDFIKYR